MGQRAVIYQWRAKQPSSPVLDAMKAEIAHAQAMLKSQPVPPYYISYEITETHAIGIDGAFGKIENSGEYRRQLDIDLRVGGYNLDNTREVKANVQVKVAQDDTSPDFSRAAPDR